MSEVVREAIVDPEDADNLVDVVESIDNPGVFGVVLLDAD